MSENTEAANVLLQGKADDLVVEEKLKTTPPQDLSLNLDLYNYDTPDAQACPYVLTSPRSLEACSRVGVKPVDLLHKTLAEFSNDLEPGKPIDEVCRLYDQHERHRIILLEKCQAERDFIIWKTSHKQRSQSLSPCRRNKPRGNKSKDGIHSCTSVHPNNPLRKYDDNLLSTAAKNQQHRFPSSQSSSPIKNKNQGLISWSTPASPYYRGSHNLFVRITSPVVCAKLQNFPKAKMRLPPKEMKILEVILQKYEKQEEEEERRARAQRMWDREKEERERRKELAEIERWKSIAAKQKRSGSEDRLRQLLEKEKAAANFCSRHHRFLQEDSSTASCPLQKRHSLKCIVTSGCLKQYIRYIPRPDL